MKNLFFTLVIFTLFFGNAFSQNSTLFSENFENTTNPDSVSFSTTSNYGKSSKLFSEGFYSDSLRIIGSTDTTIMTSNVFNTSGFPFLYLDFDQICKIEVFDAAYIEVSNNGGSSWTRLTSIHYRGASQFSSQGSKFTSASYVNSWLAGTPAVPTNSWWKSERFDISSLVGNATNVKIRFVLARGGLNMPASDNYAWFIDNIRVLGSPYEFYQPEITKITPMQDTIKGAQSYDIIAKITDNSGLDTAYLAYSLNGGIIDTVPMIQISTDTFKATIPFYGYGRTIKYNIVAIDLSQNHNISKNPSLGTYSIYAKYSTETIVELSGNGTAHTDNGPIYKGTNNSFKWSKYVFLYTAPELAAVGMPVNGHITEVAWYKTSGPATTGNALFNIVMLNSSTTAYQAGMVTFPYATITAGSTMVYNNSQFQIPSTIGWIPFTTSPFTYTGNSLEIGTDWDISQAPAQSNTAISWRIDNTFTTGRTLGAGGTSPLLNVAGFYYGGTVRPDIRMRVETPYDLSTDAGIAEISHPNSGVNANTDFDLKVKIKNYGLDTLQSVVIKWSLNNQYIGQKSLSTQLLHDSISTDIIIDTLNLGFGTHILKVWTENPNAISDMDISNDTLNFSFAACNGPMTGNYTMGNLGADFKNLAEVATALSQCGVGGAVTINIQPGVYEGQAHFNSIPGASATNKVEIVASNGDSSSVIIQYNSAGINDNYIVRTSGTKYLTFNKLTFKGTDEFYAKIFDIKDNSSNLSLTNSVIIGATANLYGDDQSLFVANPNGLDSALFIVNNHFMNGFNGLIVKGVNEDTLLSNVKILNNNFQDQNLVAADLHNIDALNFNNNLIHTTSPIIIPQGVNLIGIKNAWKFENNTINYLAGVRGISIWNCNSKINQEAIFANNMMSIGGNFLNAIIDLYNGTAIKFYNNSALKYGLNTGNIVNINTYPTNYTTDSLYFINNIFVNIHTSGSIYDLEFPKGTRAIRFSHNNYWNNSSIFASNGTVTLSNLGQWQAAIQQDSNSIIQNPNYASNTDLHIANYSLKGLGKNLSEIIYDHDGKPRGIPPTIGAHELFSLNNDIQLISILSPTNSCGLDTAETVIIRIKNNGQNIISTPFTLGYRVNQNTSIIETISQTIAIGATYDYSFTTKANFDVFATKKDSVFNFKSWVNYSLDEFVYNDSLNQTINSGYKPAIPTANVFTTNYGTSTTISATSLDTIFWFATDTISTIKGFGKYYNTPILFDTTLFYAAARNLTGMQCYSDMNSVQVNVVNFPNSDAGISSIASPASNSIISGVKVPLIATIKNYGLQTLTSAKIKYSINGILQDSVLWTGSLTQNNTTNQLVDSLLLSAGNYQIKVWTRYPNNAQDQYLNNDTLSFTLNACLSGTYTIALTGNADFNSINSAITALTNGGICGAVEFLVADGIYNGTFSIPAIQGAGPNAWISFKSASEDSSAVTLKHTITGGQTSAFQMAGTSYISFKSIGFEALTTTAEARLMEITNSANHLKFENCHFVGIPSTSASNKFAVVYTNSGSCSYLYFDNNYITNGANSLYIYGVTAVPGKGNILKNNYCTKFSSTPILGGYQDSIQITGNTVIMNQSAASTNGIYVYRSQNHATIANNYVDVSTATAGSGIMISNNLGSPYDKLMVYNNMLIVPSVTTTSYGINISTSTGLNIYYNTIKCNGTGVNGRMVYINNVSNMDFRNNIIDAKNSYVYYFNGTNTIDIMDYNAIYTDGSYFAYYSGVNKFSFSDYKAASNFDQHSLNILAPFVSATDLHMANTQLSAKGIYLNEVDEDIDGETRSLFPTIGADEVPLSSKDAALSSIIIPGNTANESDIIYPKIVICNQGLDTMNSAIISYTIDGGNPVNYNWTGSLAMFECDTVVLPSYISPAGNISFCAWVNLTSDTVILNNQICKNYQGQPTVDLQLVEILPLAEGCNLTTDIVKISVKNLGINSINSNITANYRMVGNSTIVSETKSLILSVNGIDTIVFNNAINLSTSQDTIYEIIAWIDLANDNVATNDSAKIDVMSLLSPNAPTPNHDTIDYATTGILTATSPAGTFIKWYNDQFGGNPLTSGTSLNTPIMYSHDTLWLESWNQPLVDSLKLGNATTINTGITYPTPYAGYAWGNKEQYLIRASELAYLNGTKSLTGISFDVQAINSCPTLSGYEIKIGHTSNNSMTGFLGGLTTVYSVASFQPTVGKNLHTFQIPFVWDGMSNIVIEVCFTNGSYSTNGNAGVENSVTSFNSVARYNGNYGTICTTPASFVLGAVRPNIHLQFINEGCPSNRIPLNVFVANQTTTDLGITNILSPSTDTSLTNLEILQVIVKNFGSQSQSNFTVNYQVNGGAIVSEVITIPLASGDSIIYNFSTPIDLSIPGKTFSIEAFTSLQNDSILFNDRIQKTITHLIPINCVSRSTDASLLNLIDVTIGNWNSPSNSIPSTYTNYSGKVTPPALGQGSTPLMTLVSGLSTGGSSTTNAYANVWIDFNQNKSFDNYELVLSKSLISGGSTSAMINIPTGIIDGFTLMRIVLQRNGSASSTVPCGIYQYGETEDYIVEILPQSSCDAGILNIISPKDIEFTGSQQPVWIKFQNFGTDTIQPNSLTIAYDFNGQIFDSIIYPATLAPLQIDSVSLNPITIVKGNNILIAKAIMACDTVWYNNNMNKNIFGNFIANLSYFDDFESKNEWYNGAPNIWQRGIPNGDSINTVPVGGSNVWMTLLNSNYPTNSEAELRSPIFDLSFLTNQDTAILSFNHSIFSELNHDGGNIEYSLNNGQSWTNLGYIGDPLSTNWYNTNVNGTHKWSGNIGWKTVMYKLDPSIFNQSQAIFRFKFSSDASGVNLDGWAIDNFSLQIPILPTDVGVIAMTIPSDSIENGSTVTVKVSIKNYSDQILTSIPVSYLVNGLPQVNEIWTGTINPQDTVNYIFNGKYKSLATDYTICAFTKNIGDHYTFNDSICKNINAIKAKYDVGVVSLVLPADTINTNKVSTSVLIKNFGSMAATNFPIELYMGQVLISTEMVTNNIAPNDSIIFTFSQTPNNIQGSFSLCAQTIWTIDSVLDNNEFCKNIFGTVGFENTESNALIKLKAMPNPASDFTELEFFSNENGEGLLSIIDMKGQNLIKQKQIILKGQNRIKIETINLAEGIYLLELRLNNHQKNTRLVIIK